MSFQAILTLIILIATLVVMGTQRLRADITALLVMLSLILTGILSPEEAFSAFGQPVIIVIASVYIIGSALFETGVATMIANRLARFSGRSHVVLLLVIMLTAGLLSSILTSLLVVAVLLPAVMRLARKVNTSPSQLLLPLTTAANMGNILTLIAAISNVAINDVLVSSGHASLGLFTLTPFGLASLAVAIFWYVLVGRHLLPQELVGEESRPSLQEVERSYELQEQLYQLRVRSGSDLIGQRLDAAELPKEFRLNVVAIQPLGDDLRPARPDWILEQDDLLVVEGERGDLLQVASLHHLEPKGSMPLERFENVEDQSLRLAEVMVPFRSDLVGKKVGESNFRQRYGLNILGVHREDRAVHEQLKEIRLEAGDTLLLQGPLPRLRQVGDNLNLVMVTHLGPRRGDIISSKAGLAIAIVLAMLAVVVVGLLPLSTATLAAVLALVLTGCIGVQSSYRSVDATVLILIGGMLPLATALEKTGLAQQLAELITVLDLSPLLTLLLLHGLTALLSQVVSNTVTGVLILPIAVNLAMSQGLSPTPYAIVVIIAVTASYVTPLVHSGNLMIREPGHYRMRDYLLNNGPVFLLQTAVMMVLLAAFYL